MYIFYHYYVDCDPAYIWIYLNQYYIFTQMLLALPASLLRGLPSMFPKSIYGLGSPDIHPYQTTPISCSLSSCGGLRDGRLMARDHPYLGPRHSTQIAWSFSPPFLLLLVFIPVCCPLPKVRDPRRKDERLAFFSLGLRTPFVIPSLPFFTTTLAYNGLQPLTSNMFCQSETHF